MQKKPPRYLVKDRDGSCKVYWLEDENELLKEYAKEKGMPFKAADFSRIESITKITAGKAKDIPLASLLKETGNQAKTSGKAAAAKAKSETVVEGEAGGKTE